MKEYFKIDPWRIVEDGFDAKENRVAESIFSLGNGHMGQRGNFEETYTGDTLRGIYLAGVYYPDKTRVGWWKNGYPEYFAKVLNSTNWIGINIKIDGQMLDLSKCRINQFERILNMKEGYLERNFKAEIGNGREIEVHAVRFLSLEYPEAGAIKYQIIPINFDCEAEIEIYIDGDIRNEDSNYDEKFWDGVQRKSGAGEAELIMKTKKLDFYTCAVMRYDVYKNDVKEYINPQVINKEKYVSNIVNMHINKNETLTIFKYAVITTSRDYEVKDMSIRAEAIMEEIYNKGFKKLLENQKEYWQKKWEESDIVIEGDDRAQQAIRFNIFQLNQTYTGKDDRLNIGPKGFTGEKYGGSTYWDTEAYCLPFYLSTSDPEIARNLLIYRYKHLEKAKQNARKLGFKKGALYPMVTMNGEECHNEWEITFEEIHRNAAIAYAIYNYVNYTGDKKYLEEYGFEVLTEISRFWEERVSYSCEKNKYVILGVTGPNEYENNVNNNWYTNTMAVWTLKYTISVKDYIRKNNPAKYNSLIKKLQLKDYETDKWQKIIDNMYFPENDELGIFLQQDGYMDKEQVLAKDIEPQDLPINQHWSWDRILRSCFIKQADVLQGLFFLGDKFDIETKKRNFDFYEPRTVHESSLSPCVHSILASELGYSKKAYELYLRTARLDLDNYNNDTKDGCHITSMSGTWMTIVYGFGGMRVIKGELYFNSYIPDHWKAYSFNILFRNILLNINVCPEEVKISNKSDKDIKLYVYDKNYSIKSNSSLSVPLKNK